MVRETCGPLRAAHLTIAMTAFLIAPTIAAAETVTLEDVAAGIFEASGRGGAGPGGSYFVGQRSLHDDVQRNLFIFDLESVTEPIVAARLRIFNPTNGFFSLDPVETYSVFAVSSDPGLLRAFGGGLLARDDVGSGIRYGSVEVADASNNTFVEIELSPVAIRGLNRAANEFVIGGDLTSVEPRGPEGARLFGFFRASHPRPQLVLTTDPSASFPTTQILHADATNNSGVEDGSAGNPYDTIEEAMDAATPGDRVEVAGGTYFESVVMRDQVDLHGAGPDFSVIDGLARNVGVRCPPSGTLEGFHVTNTSATAHNRARAIQCLAGASPLITGNRIVGNEATGIYLLASSAVIRNNEISGNDTFDGSCPCDAIEGVDTTPIIEENLIEARGGNISAVDLTASRSPAGLPKGFLIARNRIVGAIRLSNLSTVPPGQNAIVNNQLQNGRRRGEILNISNSPDAGLIANNTSIGGSGFVFQGGSSATIVNNIVAFGNQGIRGSSAPLEIRHNNVFGNREFSQDTNYGGIADQTGLNGNISLDPLFADRFGDGFQVDPTSPVIDAGENLPRVEPIDLEGGVRVTDGDGDGIATVDMGAVEFQGLPLFVIEIAIKSGKGIQPVNPTSRGVLPVTVLGSQDFDTADIDVTTLALGRGGAAPKHKAGGHSTNFNEDGFVDLTSHYRNQEAAVAFGDTELCVTGETLQGIPFEGCGPIWTVPACGIGFELALLLPLLQWIRGRGPARRA